MSHTNQQYLQHAVACLACCSVPHLYPWGWVQLPTQCAHSHIKAGGTKLVDDLASLCIYQIPFFTNDQPCKKHQSAIYHLKLAAFTQYSTVQLPRGGKAVLVLHLPADSEP